MIQPNTVLILTISGNDQQLFAPTRVSTTWTEHFSTFLQHETHIRLSTSKSVNIPIIHRLSVFRWITELAEIVPEIFELSLFITDFFELVFADFFADFEMALGPIQTFVEISGYFVGSVAGDRKFEVGDVELIVVELSQRTFDKVFRDFVVETGVFVFRVRAFAIQGVFAKMSRQCSKLAENG